MKNNRKSSFPLAVLCAGVSSVALLSGCDMMSNISNPFGTGRQEQQVNGARRLPPGNAEHIGVPGEPQMMAPPPGYAPPPPSPGESYAPPPPPPAAAAPAPLPGSAASMEQNPYDYYDASGNPVAPKTAASAPDGKPGFFGRLFGSPQKKDDVRKPFSGSASHDEPVSDAPVNEAPQITPLLTPAPSDNGRQSQMESPEPAPVQASESEPAKPAKRSLFDRIFGRDAPSTPPAGDQKTPELSSVPQKPSSFATVKEQRQEELDDLKFEHWQAQHDKQDLDNEPSQQQVVKPVETNSLAPETVAPAPGDEPVLLGHVAAPPPTAAPPAKEVTLTMPPSTEAPAPQDMPVTEAKAEAPAEAPAAQDTAHPTYWWQGWDMFSKKKTVKKPQEEEQQAQEPPPAAPVEEVTTQAPANTEITPLLAPPPAQAAPAVAEAPAPAVIPASAPVAAAEETPVVEATATAAAPAPPDNGLPSPQILQQVKMLPPSRYLERDRAFQKRSSDSEY